MSERLNQDRERDKCKEGDQWEGKSEGNKDRQKEVKQLFEEKRMRYTNEWKVSREGHGHQLQVKTQYLTCHP